MEFGIGRATSYQELVDDARWAEQNGFRAVCVSDHFLRAGGEDPERAKVLSASDPFVHLAGLARETESIELVLTVASVTFRHPAVVLKSAIDLDLMSNGRFVLGVGTGYRESEHDIFGVPFPDLTQRYEMLENYLGYLRAGLSVPNLGYGGKYYELKEHPICPAPTGRVRLIVGGEGPRRTPGVAGHYADEYNIFPMGGDDMRKRIERARAACKEWGRDPDLLALSSGGPIISGPTWKEYREALAESASRARVDVDELEKDHHEHGRLIGTFDEVAARLQDFADAGIARFYIGFEGEGAMDRERLLSMISAIAPQTP